MSVRSLAGLAAVASISLLALAPDAARSHGAAPRAQIPAAREPVQIPKGADGPEIFAYGCASCHSTAQSGRTPGRFSLSRLSPRAIVDSLVDGSMRVEGKDLTHEQRVMVAEFLARRPYEETVLPESAYCSERGYAPLDLDDVSWMGWGGDLAATGFQSAERAALHATDVSRLELRWAFAFPDASEVRTKPTVVGEVAIVGDQFGRIYALETGTGCARWVFESDSAVRGAVLVDRDAEGRQAAYFVDFRTSAYALDVATGELLWKTRVGRHPEANTTGSPAVHDGRLFVPISSMEVVTAMDPTYECCSSSGALAALDSSTGELLWYHRVIPEEPVQAGTSAAGTQLWAPSGAPIWASPTIDVERGFVYVGTGENYTHPTTGSSDAILAIEIETGALAWAFQATDEDAFNMACTVRQNRDNCPTPVGPDVDFGMSPLLVQGSSGKQVLVAGQKSGVVWALDPDADGEVLWSTRVGKGGALGGIHWGMASDGELVYAANADRPDAVIVDVNPDRDPTPGLHALDLLTGELVWEAPAPADTCEGKRGCFRAISAAPTAMPGIVFAAGLDGRIRAHSSEDGSVLWEFDTVRDFETVNGVPGRGGAIDGPGPVVAGGLLFVNSGYDQFGQMAGNVLLAFGVPSR